MMTNKRILFILLAAEALFCLILALFYPGSEGLGLMTLLGMPFSQIGSLLRSLSLSGPAGNVIAFSIYILTGALPLVSLAFRMKKKKAGAEDIVLPLMSVLLFIVLYLMINPGLIKDWLYSKDFDAAGMIPMGKAVLGGTLYSVLISYLVFKTLRRIKRTKTDKLLDMLRMLFIATVVVIVFAIFYTGVRELAAAIHEVGSANDQEGVNLAPTYIFIILGFLFKQIPTAITALLFLKAIELAEALKADRYGEAAIVAADRLSKISKTGVAVIMLTAMSFNLLQLLFSRTLHYSYYSAQVPLEAIILTLVMMLLGRYFSESSRLHLENRMFI